MPPFERSKLDALSFGSATTFIVNLLRSKDIIVNPNASYFKDAFLFTGVRIRAREPMEYVDRLATDF